MPVLRLVAAAHVTAGSAESKMHPCLAGGEAFFAARRIGAIRHYEVEMAALGRHERIDPEARVAYADCFKTLLSMGGLRTRLPVAAKTALVTAGTMQEVPASPIPPGGSALLTMWTSTAGASFMRKMR
jgi:hypothetical protein